MCYLLLPGFWYDEQEREINVNEWSDDRLHPGLRVGSLGFAQYYHALRHLILVLIPFIAQTKLMARIDYGLL